MTTLPRGRYLDRATPPHISTLIVLTGLGAMSMNVFLPSLPGMAAYFSADYALMQLSISLYLAVNAVLQLFIGPVSDRYGRRPVLLASLALFCLATTGCILAPSAGIFLAFRMAQGVIVAGLVLGRAVVRDMVPQEQAASMIGYVTMGMAVVPMISPAVGGLLDQAFGWHSTFILLLVAGLVVLWLTWSDLGETAQNRATSLRDQFRQYPELFASHRFWGYCLSATFASGAFFAFIGGAPFVGVQVYGLDSVQVGLCVGAPALGYFSGNFLSGRYSIRMGVNWMITAGAAISTLGMVFPFILNLIGAHGPTLFFGAVTLVGLGNGLLMPSANAGMLSVRPHLAGSASGIGGAIMIFGGALLSALAGWMLGPGSTAMPLIVIMLVSSALALAAIFYTIRRERQISGGF
ncbi:MAG: multidrug effflux MFS transporter [Rhodobacteraceae bacterium]|nr:multidrug effflux MFS transporter [Paracoccaceae bacterium]MCP5341817.1 multidrug effflux MFS transporter [Paracoccaceae bacterium]